MSRPANPKLRGTLLRAAEAVFCDKGLEQARVEDITDRAGCSKGAFYLHFGTKEEAFEEIVKALMQRLVACSEASVLPGPPADLDPAHRAALEFDQDLRLFLFCWENRRFARLLMTGAGSIQFGHLVDGFAQQSERVLATWLAQGQRAGVCRADLDVQLASLAVSGMYDRLARMVIARSRKPDLVALVAGLQRLVSRAIGSPAFVDATEAEVRRRLGETRSSKPGPPKTLPTSRTAHHAR
jgi:AcrR family transcriptional regulator